MDRSQVRATARQGIGDGPVDVPRCEATQPRVRVVSGSSLHARTGSGGARRKHSDTGMGWQVTWRVGDRANPTPAKVGSGIPDALSARRDHALTEEVGAVRAVWHVRVECRMPIR